MVKDNKKKKKLKMTKRCSNGNDKGDISDNNNTNNAIGDDFVVYEILSRLPVKTLVRFKSVCKRWMSTIQHDPHFHQLHYNHSTTRPLLRLFIGSKVRGYDHRVLGHREYFLSAGSSTTLIHTFLDFEISLYDEILPPVNGLVCLADHLGSCVCVYNPSTREETQWIQTTTRKRKNSCDGPSFVFGFDPVTKKHKVFCHRAEAGCEVWTVGDNSWRRIDHDQLPPYELQAEYGIYVNGAMYWLNALIHEWHNGAPEVIVAFDVGSEKFTTIPIPDFIFDQPMEPFDLDKWCGRRIFLLEVDGHVALLCRRDKNTVSMWILLDADDGHDGNWTEVTMILPFDWAGRNKDVRFHSIPGMTGEILVTTSIKRHSAYSYNWKKNAFTKVQMSKRSSPVIKSHNIFEGFAESLFPVNNYN